jgi:hypothetical protein
MRTWKEFYRIRSFLRRGALLKFEALLISVAATKSATGSKPRLALAVAGGIGVNADGFCATVACVQNSFRVARFFLVQNSKTGKI